MYSTISTITWTPPTLSPPTAALNISEHLVTSVLRKVDPNKAAGPDRLRGRVLKDCSTQLGGVFTRLFLAPFGLRRHSQTLEGINQHAYP